MAPKRDLQALMTRTAEQGKKLVSRVWGGADKPLQEGDVLVGTLIAIDQNVGEHGSTMLRFADPKGEEVATWQRGTLKTKFTSASIGKAYMIQFKGKVPPKAKGDDPMYDFEVYEIDKKTLAEWAELDELPF